ncbi:MAG: SH3 domain-containing protein [Thermomicrobiales bacterium]
MSASSRVRRRTPPRHCGCASAGTGYGTIAILPAGTVVTIISGPIFANTYGWYRVSPRPYGTGWVGDYLQ